MHAGSVTVGLSPAAARHTCGVNGKRLATAGRVVFGAVVLGFLAVALVRNASRLRDVDLDLAPGWLLAAAPFTFAGGLLLPQAWREVLAAYGSRIPASTALRVWCVAQAARLVPGTVAFVASRIVLTVRLGVPRSVATASFAIEMAMLALWCAWFTSWLPSTQVPGLLRLAIVLGATLALVLVPLALRFAGVRVSWFPSADTERARPTVAYGAVLLYGVNNLVRTIGFFFVTAAFVPVRAGDLFLVVAATNLGALAGMIGITPAGIGVREGALVALLGDRFGFGNAAALAAVYRMWEFAFELVWLAIAHLLDRDRSSDVIEVAPAEVPEPFDGVRMGAGDVDGPEAGRVGLEPPR